MSHRARDAAGERGGAPPADPRASRARRRRPWEHVRRAEGRSWRAGGVRGTSTITAGRSSEGPARRRTRHAEDDGGAALADVASTRPWRRRCSAREDAGELGSWLCRPPPVHEGRRAACPQRRCPCSGRVEVGGKSPCAQSAAAEPMKPEKRPSRLKARHPQPASPGQATPPGAVVDREARDGVDERARCAGRVGDVWSARWGRRWRWGRPGGDGDIGASGETGRSPNGGRPRRSSRPRQPRRRARDDGRRSASRPGTTVASRPLSTDRQRTR